MALRAVETQTYQGIERLRDLRRVLRDLAEWDDSTIVTFSPPTRDDGPGASMTVDKGRMMQERS